MVVNWMLSEEVMRIHFELFSCAKSLFQINFFVVGSIEFLQHLSLSAGTKNSNARVQSAISTLKLSG